MAGLHVAGVVQRCGSCDGFTTGHCVELVCLVSVGVYVVHVHRWLGFLHPLSHRQLR